MSKYVIYKFYLSKCFLLIFHFVIAIYYVYWNSLRNYDNCSPIKDSEIEFLRIINITKLKIMAYVKRISNFSKGFINFQKFYKFSKSFY